MHLLVYSEVGGEDEELAQALSRAGLSCSVVADLRDFEARIKSAQYDALIIRPPARELGISRLRIALSKKNPAPRLLLLAPAALPGAALISGETVGARAAAIAKRLGASIPGALLLRVIRPLADRRSWSSAIVELGAGQSLVSSLEASYSREHPDVLEAVRSLGPVLEVRHSRLGAVLENHLDDRSAPYLLWDVPEGELLSTKIANAPLEVSQAVSLGLGVSAAVSALHTRGFRHGFVHPQAIWLSPGAPVQLLFAGFAEVGEQVRRSARREVETSRLREPELAPELVRGEEPSAAIDAYGLGITLFRAICGRMPFGGSSDLEVLLAIRDQPTPDPSGVADMPKPLARLLVALLAKDPAARPSVKEAHEELTNLA